MKLTLIAAMAKNRVIGKNNDLIWHLPDDLRHFKNLTRGHHLIMGRKTFASMNYKPLPKRVNIIVTRDKSFQAPGCIVVHSLKEAIYKAESDEQPFVAGGAEIYAQALPLADCMEITHIHEEFEGDTFFPEWDPGEWTEVQRKHHPEDEKHRFAFDFVTYSRKHAEKRE